MGHSRIQTLTMVAARGGGVATAVLEEVTVTGKLDQLMGVPISASQGIVTDEQLSLRPVLRPGELLESVPGLVVTQHSGSGKANQFFLRGFNLDPGTDLATSVGGVPVNMPLGLGSFTGLTLPLGHAVELLHENRDAAAAMAPDR